MTLHELVEHVAQVSLYQARGFSTDCSAACPKYGTCATLLMVHYDACWCKVNLWEQPANHSARA